MLLLIDIGNSNITLGIWNRKIQCFDRFDTEKDKNYSFYKKEFLKYFKKHKIDKTSIEGVVFCSVAPTINSVFKKVLKKILRCQIFETGKDLRFLIKNKYKKPKQVGADRLINAISAHNIYPNNNIIIVDFGTAITFDMVSKKGEYLGGLIIPGLKSSLRALSKEAELLPEIRLMRVKGLIGKDTATSMRNGILYATAFACDGIINKFEKRFNHKAKVIATGGYASLIKRYTRSTLKEHPHLTLRGLYINYRENSRKTKKI